MGYEAITGSLVVRVSNSPGRYSRVHASERTMKMDPDIQRRMIRNAALSAFIYALPVLLMFLTLYLRHSRPWENAQITGSGLGMHQDRKSVV